MTPCDLCGAQDRPTRRALVIWKEPVTIGQFDTAQRCVNVVGCQARIEDSGEPWPLLEEGDEIGVSR